MLVSVGTKVACLIHLGMVRHGERRCEAVVRSDVLAFLWRYIDKVGDPNTMFGLDPTEKRWVLGLGMPSAMSSSGSPLTQPLSLIETLMRL